MLYLIGYQVSDCWCIKIGVAVDLPRWPRQLQTGIPHKLTLLKSIRVFHARLVESHMHTKMRHYRRVGECFVLPKSAVQSLIEAMDRLQTALSQCPLETMSAQLTPFTAGKLLDLKSQNLRCRYGNFRLGILRFQNRLKQFVFI